MEAARQLADSIALAIENRKGLRRISVGLDINVIAGTL
jgi:hypothetical protein